MTPSKPSSKSVLGRIKVSYPRIHRLMVPLDFSGKSRQALRYAVPLAQKFGARIVLLHVLPDTRGTSASTASLLTGTPAEQRAAALKRLQATAASLVPTTIRTDFSVLVGDPTKKIIEAIEKHDVDLLVLTTTGRTGLKRILIGSTAEQVMRHAPCPVLSVRRR